MLGPRLRSSTARHAPWRVPVAVSVGVHAALIGLAWSAWQARQEAAPARSLVVRMIEWVAPVETTPGQEAEERPSLANPGTRRAPRRSSLPADAPAPADEVRLPDTAPQVPAASTTTPDGSATPAIDPDSIQRAARQAARSRSLVQQSNDLIGTKPPPTAQERLGAQVARSAKGDCLKGGEGGYEKQGLGLLGIPFLIVDAATGNCRK